MDRDERVGRAAEVSQQQETCGARDRGGAHGEDCFGGARQVRALDRHGDHAPEQHGDEQPDTGLGAQLRFTMQRELLRIWERDRKTIIFVTHDLDEAILLADKIVVFGTRPGRVIHVEDVPLERPRDLAELRGNPVYGEMWERLWKLLDHSTVKEEA